MPCASSSSSSSVSASAECGIATATAKNTALVAAAAASKVATQDAISSGSSSGGSPLNVSGGGTEQEQSSDPHMNHNSATMQNSKRRVASSHSNKRRRASDNQSSNFNINNNNNNNNGSSDSGSSDDEDNNNNNNNDEESQIQQPDGWRVKLYRLNQDGSWDDCGTGRIVCLYSNNNNNNSSNVDTSLAVAMTTTTTATLSNKTHKNNNSTINNNEATLCVQAEVHKGMQNNNSNSRNAKRGTSPPGTNSSASTTTPRVLLRTRILLTDVYQRQGDNIITWCEPCFYSDQEPTTAETGVDLALSFQDNAGCLDIWRQITHVQRQAAARRRQQNARQQQQQPVEDLAAQAAAQHHADIQQRLQQSSWDYHHHQQQQQQQSLLDNVHSNVNSNNNNMMTTGPSSADGPQSNPLQLLLGLEQLPSPPTLQNLEDIADTIAGLQHVQQRESLAAWIVGGDPDHSNMNDSNSDNHNSNNNSNNNDECLYLRQLLELFPAAEARGDYPKLATLAACVKTILLLNDPSILELIVNVASIFEQVCSCLEYDPDLREKANHRWFLRERVRFRTVLPMEDPDLVEAIHRSFRVNYLRDTLLRPTMDESSLSTLASLQTFTHADVIKGVTMSTTTTTEPDDAATLRDSYLVRVIRLLGVELYTLASLDWMELEKPLLAPSQESGGRHHYDSHLIGNEPVSATHHYHHHHHDQHQDPQHQQYHSSSLQHRPPTPTIQSDPSMVVNQQSLQSSSVATTTWKQYVAPQDFSVEARRLRRQGCVSFLKELFNMVRMSLQQSDKDDFFNVLCTLEIDLNEDRDISDSVSQTSQNVEVGSVASTVRSERLDDRGLEEKHNDSNNAQPILPTTNLLSLLGMVLSDPNTDTAEKGSVLEILSGITMHDPSLIRRHCLNCHEQWKRDRSEAHSSSNISEYSKGRVRPNEMNQVINIAPANDLLSSLLLLMNVETDAGVLLQVSEIMRIILDTDVMMDHGPLSPGLADEAEGLLLPGPPNPPHELHNQPSGLGGATSTGQKRFLAMFYDHYVEWLVAPLQFTILQPSRRVPESVLAAPVESALFQRILKAFEKGIAGNDPYLRTVPPCAIRTSFAVELLSFCVRAHLYRMKSFLLKTGVIGNVLKLLRPRVRGVSGDRCLKLAALRFLRAVLSVNDEFYHRHIIQHNLFAPVFEAFRANPVGDNLVSSAIVEMCDYIHSENIKSLLEYIVTTFLSSHRPDSRSGLTLEDVSSPYVSTLTTLRKAYEENIQATQQPHQDNDGEVAQSSPGGSRYFPSGLHRQLSGQALEEQRKFLEVDSDESYFDIDDENEVQQQQQEPLDQHSSVPQVAHALEAQNKEREMHRTPRMFSLTQTSLLNSPEDSNEQGKL